MRELMKATGYGRSGPIQHAAVFVVPPYDRRKERYRSQSATVIQQGESFSATPELEAFIARIKEGQS
ncbi:MAG: hypothetical protein GY922_07060 [Proteobacteria bacterium]|nr:hypothetical protein [Pseudomonadota bacterium]